MKRPQPTPRESVRDRIRSAGLRCTAARLAVLGHLLSAKRPATHAEVAEALADKGFDRATIYRNLTELTDAGIATRVELGDHVWRFEVRREDAAGHHEESHPHFLCTTCGEVSCLDDVTVAITPKLPMGTQAGKGVAGKRSGKAAGRATGIHTVTEVLLKGQCGNCG